MECARWNTCCSEESGGRRLSSMHEASAAVRPGIVGPSLARHGRAWQPWGTWVHGMMPSKSLMTLLGPGTLDQKESKKGPATAAVASIVVVIARENAERAGERERDMRQRDVICPGQSMIATCRARTVIDRSIHKRRCRPSIHHHALAEQYETVDEPIRILSSNRVD